MRRAWMMRCRTSQVHANTRMLTSARVQTFAKQAPQANAVCNTSAPCARTPHQRARNAGCSIGCSPRLMFRASATWQSRSCAPRAAKLRGRGRVTSRRADRRRHQHNKQARSYVIRASLRTWRTQGARVQALRRTSKTVAQSACMFKSIPRTPAEVQAERHGKQPQHLAVDDDAAAQEAPSAAVSLSRHRAPLGRSSCH